VIAAMHGERDAVVRESADLLYNLVVVWAVAGVRPADVWKEMHRREELFGIAEKLLKHDMPVKVRPKVTPLPDRRLRGRR
jgi:phosphoribosyl-ATP pyrophosphohydrolase